MSVTIPQLKLLQLSPVKENAILEKAQTHADLYGISYEIAKRDDKEVVIVANRLSPDNRLRPKDIINVAKALFWNFTALSVHIQVQRKNRYQ